MQEQIDLHGYGKELNVVITTLKKASDLDERVKERVLEFHNNCFAQGLSVGRVSKYLYMIIRIARILGDRFLNPTKEDVISLVQHFETSSYSEWSKHDYRVAIKKFYKWHLGKDEHYPEPVRWIRTPVKVTRKRLPNPLSEEEIRELIESCNHPRDKALVAVLYESGARIGELCPLRLSDIRASKYGFQITVFGKTGSRRILLIASAPYLAAWLNLHPRRSSPEAPLWVGIGTRSRNQLLRYEAVRTLLRALAKKTGMRKRLHPHLFRHSRATYLANHLTEAQLCQYFG